MIILGLAGQAGVGKDTVANYLRDHYGFIVFAFSDMLYKEVQVAFGLEAQDLLRNRDTKELPSDLLTLQQCSDTEFAKVATKAMDDHNKALGIDLYLAPDAVPLSPRQVLQWWGTQYRRAQDPDYWVKQAHKFVRAVQNMPAYPEQRPQYFVECGTRFKNERDWIRAAGGNVWHIYRDGIESGGQGHVSAVPLEVVEGERELWNNDSIERLHAGIDLLLRTGARFVRVEPMAQVTDQNSAELEAAAVNDVPVEQTDYAALECGHLGDPAAQTGIYAPEINCAVAERIQ